MLTNEQLIQTEIENEINRRTGRRIRDLDVACEGNRVVLRGRAPSYYLKQLAQHGALDVLPEIAVENEIEVSAGATPARPGDAPARSPEAFGFHTPAADGVS